MSDSPISGESLADDIVDVGIYEAILPHPRDFLPWHRPRKQYVRHHQWCEQINRLLDDAPLTDGPLKYLGLPGVDLLDLRHFHSAVCLPRNIGMRFLGFNRSAVPTSDAHTDLNISMDEVRRLSNVDPMSDVIGDDFALLSKEDSLACRKTKELGPYDVINLDLCDGFGAQTPGTLNRTYYDAVNSLLALQSRSMRPWLLLLTTRADRANVDDQVLSALQNKYADNLASYDVFRAASLEKFEIETAESLSTAIGTDDGLLAVFLTGLCKWFLSLALAHQPPTSVELCSVIGYRVDRNAECEDLISLALRFTPTLIPAADPIGLAQRQISAPNEGTLATRALKRVAKRVDADKILRETDGVRQTMIDATAALLGLARYDEQAYREWVNANQF